MDEDEYTALLNALVMGSIHGMQAARDDIQEHYQSGAVPPLDDALMLDAAVLLTATLIEANPDYQDAKRFGKGADMVRGQVMDRLRWVRRKSDALGTKLLYHAIEAATGMGPIANDRG